MESLFKLVFVFMGFEFMWWALFGIPTYYRLEMLAYAGMAVVVWTVFQVYLFVWSFFGKD